MELIIKIIPLFLVFLLANCSGEEPVEPKDNVPYVYLSQAALGAPYTIPDNYIYNEGDSVIRIPLSVYRTGLQDLEVYSVSISQTNLVLANTCKLPVEAYTLQDTIYSEVDVRTTDFSLDLDIDFLKQNKDTNFSIVLSLANPSKFILDESLKTVKILIKTEELLKATDLYYDWELKFEDNFDGIKVDETNWGIYNGGSGPKGIGLTKRDVFSVKNGLLVVSTYKDENGVIISGGMAHYTNYLYGRFEFKVKMDSDPYESVGGVILTWPKGNLWPTGGELDIYEVAVKDNTFSTFIHYGADNSTKQFHHDVDKTEWHTMRLDWFEDALHLYRDGVKVWELTDKVTIPQVLHHLCIQAGPNKPIMGDNPINMYVDWVRIYQIRK